MAERTSRPAPATRARNGKGVRAFDMSAISLDAVFGVRLAIALVALAVTARASPVLAATCAVGEAGCCGAEADCDDGDPCNGAEMCEVVTGTCLPGLPVDGVACNDGDACTVADTCQGGVCVGTAVVCTPSDQCHAAGTCNPATGTCSDPAQLDGTPCDDGDACTQTDTCAAGACVGANPVVCTAADQCHTAGVCNPASGVCSSPAKLDGAPCDDGSACTQTDACEAGICVGAIHDLALAQHRALLAPDTARDLRHRGRGLLRGTKALKRSLRRLKRVSQSFTR